MQLKRLRDARLSNIPQAIGLCAADNTKLLATINEAQERLVYAGGEAGWWGSWAKMAFNVISTGASADPFITLPRTVARLIDIDMCRFPVPIQNEFYEFLEAGVGLQSPVDGQCSRHCTVPQGYDRGCFPAFTDMTPGKLLRFYTTDPLDVDRRIFVQGTDTNDMTIYSLDGYNQVKGIWLNLTSSFVDTPFALNTLTGLQKDITIGVVQVYEVDSVTGDQTLISTMDPSEEVAGYRRYFLGGLPSRCCGDVASTAPTVQVSAMAKLAFIPVVADTDYLIIQNIPALKEECQAVRFGEMDDSTSASQSLLRHQKAVRLLNGELIHHLGKDRPAVAFSPFGNAHLRNQRIGSMT